jgi:aminoglycoside phosphotransferase (APT) family kinase protein
MSNPTQRTLSSADVCVFVAASFGHDVAVAGCAELHGGGFATVWRVHLDDGRTVVLKVAPPAGARLLRYEDGLTEAESHYFQLVGAQAPGVPVPEVLHHWHDRDVCDGDWLFTSHLPGIALSELSGAAGQSVLTALDESAVRWESGVAVAQLHQVTGDRYGYSGARTHASSWPTAFGAMVEDLLADAVDWQVELPVPAARLRQVVSDSGDALNVVDRPSLVHFDLWDGNVLAAPDGAGAAHLSGLVDGERFLFGDPLIDLVSPVLFRRIENEPEHPFLGGYAHRSGRPTFDDAALRRLSLYRVFLYLLMTVEMPSRGMTGQADRGRRDHLAGLLQREVADLGRTTQPRERS